MEREETDSVREEPDLYSDIAGHVPGMYPNAPKRNVIVLIVYVLGVLVFFGALRSMLGLLSGIAVVLGSVGETRDRSIRFASGVHSDVVDGTAESAALGDRGNGCPR